MGPEDPSNWKKIPIIFLKPNFRKLQEDSKNVSLKIRCKGPKKGVLNLFLSISMAYNVISCQKVAENTQILKIAKFAM